VPDVVIIAPSADPNAGGVERFAANLRNALIQSGIDAVVLAPNHSARISRLAARLGLAPFYLARRLRPELERLRPALVISNGTLGWIGRGSYARVHVFHGTMPAHSLSQRRFVGWREWLVRGFVAGGMAEFLSGLGATRIAVSRSAAREVRHFFHLDVQRVIPNGVPIPANPVTPHERTMVTFVGRREARKGYEAAVTIASAAGYRLSVAGPGMDLRTDDLGVLDDSRLLDVLGRSKVMLFPTRYEACSYAILEAISNGCAVVTTPVGWIEELLDHVPEYAMFVANPDDHDGLTRALRLALEPTAAAERALERARGYAAQNNSIAAFRSEWLAVVRDILHDRASRRPVS
jgi:glycosyltransferase involved in cell wall biosynthesis